MSFRLLCSGALVAVMLNGCAADTGVASGVETPTTPGQQLAGDQ